jgi:hypothetical protein
MSMYVKLFSVIFLIYGMCTNLNASPVAVTCGGTDLTSATAYAVLCGGTTNVGAFQSVASVGSSGQALLLSSASTLSVFTTLAREYAFVYSKAASQVVNVGSSIPFELNGPISSGISHSTVTNNDQITINTAGTYWFMWCASADATRVTVSLTVNGASNTATQYSFLGAGGQQPGQYIASITAGQIIRLTVFSDSLTLTGSATKICAGLVIKQIS